MLRLADQFLWRKARIEKRRKQLKRSFELQDSDLASQVAECKIALEKIFDEFGPVRTMNGSVERAKGWTSHRDDDVLIEWALENRPALVDYRLPQTALLAAGAKWADGQMILEGEIVPGISRARSEGVSISVAVANEESYFEADDEHEAA